MSHFVAWRFVIVISCIQYFVPHKHVNQPILFLHVRYMWVSESSPNRLRNAPDADQYEGCTLVNTALLSPFEAVFVIIFEHLKCNGWSSVNYFCNGIMWWTVKLPSLYYNASAYRCFTYMCLCVGVHSCGPLGWITPLSCSFCVEKLGQLNQLPYSLTNRGNLHNKPQYVLRSYW